MVFICANNAVSALNHSMLKFLSPIPATDSVVSGLTRLSIAVSAALFFSTIAPSAAAEVFTVEAGKAGVLFGDDNRSEYDAYQKIKDGDDFSYSAIDLSQTSERKIYIRGKTVNLVSDGGQFIIGTDDAVITSYGGGTLNAGTESGTRGKLKAKSLEARHGGEAYLTNMDAALSDTLGANSEHHLKNAVVTTKTTEVEGTLVLENSTLNTDYFLGGTPDEIKLIKSRINNPVKKQTIIDDDGKPFEAYDYRVTQIRETNVAELTLTDSSAEFALSSWWLGSVALETSLAEQHGSFAHFHFTASNLDGTAIEGNGFGSNVNFKLADYTTLALSHLTYTANDRFKKGGNWPQYGTEADYADEALVKERITASVATLKTKPKAILYTSVPMRFQTVGSNQILVGSDATADGNAIVFGSSSLFLVDMEVAGSYWRIQGEENEPFFSTLDGNPIKLSVADTSQLYIKGLTKDTQNLKVVDDHVKADKLWKVENIFTDNPLYGFKFDDDGKTIIAQIQTPKAIFGDAMMSAAMFEEAYRKPEADRSDTERYLVEVLNALGNNKSFTTFTKEQIAEVGNKADMLLNPAGAAAVYSTAFDASDEVIQTVQRSMASVKDPESHAWAALLGGKAKIDELPASVSRAGASSSTRGVTQRVKRDAYGVAVGFDTPVASGVRVGLAGGFSSGNTKNDSVGVKDEFDAWTLMAYARYGMGPFTLDGHAAATLLQSEVSNNYSRSKADMSTWVYNLGGRASVGVLLGETIVYPFVGAEFFHLKGEEYDAGPGIKARPGATSSTVMVPVGLNWEGNYKTRWGVASPVLGFSWARVFGDRTLDASSSALGETTNYTFTFADRTLMRIDLGLSLKGDNYDYSLYGTYVDGSQDRQAYKLSTSASYHF